MSNLNLPCGWTTTTLGAFMNFKNGVNADKDAYGKGIKFVNVMDIFRKNCLSSDDVVGSVEITNKQLNEYSVVRGDILFNRTSETPEEIAFSSVYLGEEKITFGGFVIRGRQTKQLLLPEFAKYCFKTDTIRKEMIRRSQGAVRANIGQKDLSKVPIVIPPETDQKMIVAILDEWGHMIEKTEALIDAKERQFGWLRANIIKNVQNTNTQKFGDFLKESRIPDTIDNPQKRLTVRLHLKGVDVREYRGTEKEGATQYFIRKSGQLIYGKQNIFRGSIGIIPNALDGYSSSQDIPAFDIAESVNADWLYWYMSRPHFYERLEHFAAGSGSKRLHPKELFKMNVDVPPIEKQKEVVAFLDTAQQEITLLKKLADQYRTQKRGLMQKLLAGKCEVKL